MSQKTEVYLGYTEKNLYVVCVCIDSEPNKIRARMSRCEQINEDDQFGFVLDTFHDKKHGVFFYVNPVGVQQDGIWTEQDPDYSFDMLWNSDARLTPRGYVIHSIRIRLPILRPKRASFAGRIYAASATLRCIDFALRASIWCGTGPGCSRSTTGTTRGLVWNGLRT